MILPAVAGIGRKQDDASGAAWHIDDRWLSFGLAHTAHVPAS